jgi:hypothetical protein
MAYNYGWVGSAVNAWTDKEDDVIHLQAIADDIQRKTLAIQKGVLPHYGDLDVMHDHSLTIGFCIMRALLDGSRAEIDAGYINPEWDALAEKMVGKKFTMSHESYIVTKAFRIKIPLGIAKAIMRGPLREFVQIDTFRFTVAKPGAEANAITEFVVVKLAGEIAKDPEEPGDTEDNDEDEAVKAMKPDEDMGDHKKKKPMDSPSN